MFEALFQHVRKSVELTAANENNIAPFLGLLQLRKRQKLLLPGKVCQFMAFVVRGVLRIYYKDAQDVEYTLYFTPENFWAIDLISFQRQQPSELYIESMEEAELITIDYHSWQELQGMVPVMREFSQQTLRQALMVEQARSLSLLRDSAQTRYQRFLLDYPQLTQRIPQKYIASYLGISPEFLSKIRRQMLPASPILRTGDNEHPAAPTT